MIVDSVLRDLLLATWRVSPGAIARKLPPGVDPDTTAEGDGLVSLLGVRSTSVRAAGLPLPRFGQVTLRTYVLVDGEPAVFFLGLRVTTGGLGGALYGIPVRLGRIRVREGQVRAPGLGLRVRYRRLGAPGAPPLLGSGPLGHHDVAYFASAGLRRLATSHPPFAWEAAELSERPRLDPVSALGLDVGEPDWLLYAARTEFRTTFPTVKVAHSPS